MSKKHGIVFACILALLVCNGVALAAPFLSDRMKLTGGVRPAILSFALFDEDGVTPIERFDFPDFIEGRIDNRFKNFYLNNTGDDSLTMGWSISDSSITWTRAGELTDGYYYIHEADVDGVKVLKYEFEIMVLPPLAPALIRFSAEYPAITLGPGVGVPCVIRFTYMGEPATKEHFTWQPNFYAYETFPSD